ncbi:MAG TPA: hypothetical protein VN578_02550 [Candidatus Binatia bacterium]|nr:hypothetical protein [Candidatus Binatia bacterium]
MILKSSIPNGNYENQTLGLRSSLEVALFFPEIVQHSEAINLETLKPVSAGFFHRSDDGSIIVEAEGSVSLSLEPRPSDAEVIADTLKILGL